MTGFNTPGFSTLENFYESLKWSNPAMALLMHADLMAVAVGGMSGNRDSAYSAVMRLRDRAQGLSVPLAKILDHALSDLGYSLEQAAQTQIALDSVRRSRRIHTL